MGGKNRDPGEEMMTIRRSSPAGESAGDGNLLSSPREGKSSKAESSDKPEPSSRNRERSREILQMVTVYISYRTHTYTYTYIYKWTEG